jgi:hypothetical protein
MSIDTSPDRVRVVALFASSAAFAGASWVFLAAPTDVILGIVPDDAFYYLQIARNLAQTGRSTADGVANTNGYHPLWMLWMTGLAWLTPDSEKLLRAAMVASLVFHVCAAGAVKWSLHPVVGARWASTAAACWLVNPLAYLIAQQAVEGALYALALLLVFGLYIRIGCRAAGDLPLTASAGFGAALGVLCLARTEGAIVVLLAFTWLAVRAAKPPATPAATVARLAVAAAACSGIVLPWLWFSWKQVGTIVQDSGAMKALWAAEINHTTYEWLRNVVLTAVYIIRFGFSLLTGLDVPMEPLIAFCFLLLGAAALVEARTEGGSPVRALRAVIASVISFWLAYGFMLTAPQLWWLTLPCLSLVLLIFIIGPALFERWRVPPASQAWAQSALIAASLAAFVALRWPTAARYPWQADVRRSQAAVEALVPPSARIGSFNAGIPMFFGSAPVVALDGLVNHDARVAWGGRRFDEFLRRANVAYIADEQAALDHGLQFMQRRPHLERLASYPLTGWPTGERVLWRLSWPDSRPE